MRGASVNERLQAAQESASPAELIAALGDSSPEVAKAAASRLAQVAGPEVAGELRRRMLSSEPSRAGAIASALKALGDEGAVDVAIAGLQEEPYTRRLAAASALLVFAQRRAAAALRGAVRDPVAGVRAAALDALAGLGRSERSASDCAPLLGDPEPYVRGKAVEAIARTASLPGRLLAAAVHDRDAYVRQALAHHLCSLPSDAARALLSDPELRVREVAVRGAGRDQIGALVAMLGKDPGRDVRLAAAQKLAEVGDERVASGLIPALEDSDDMVRVAALRALARLLTPPGAIERLRAELRSSTPGRRRSVLYALARVVAPGEAGCGLEGDLARLVEDPDPAVRASLIHAGVGLVTDPRPMVEYLAGDPDTTVRHAATMWLMRHPDRESV